LTLAGAKVLYLVGKRPTKLITGLIGWADKLGNYYKKQYVHKDVIGCPEGAFVHGRLIFWHETVLGYNEERLGAESDAKG